MKIESKLLQDLNRFFAAKRYDQAISLLKELLVEHSSDLSLKMKLADAYALMGNRNEAENILAEIAKQLAQAGYITKAIAIQKKIQRIKPDSEFDVYKYIEEIEQVSKSQQEVIEEDHTPKKDSKMKALDRLFKGLNQAEFQEIFSRMEQKQLASGEYVFKEGDQDNSVFIIISGQVKVLLDQGEDFLELATLDESDFFGEVALLTGKTRTASVLCVVDCEFLVMNRDNYSALSKKYPALQESLAAALEFRAQKTIEKLTQM
jgi:tetratricopeptide (TPR) repeat protein